MVLKWSITADLMSVVVTDGAGLGVLCRAKEAPAGDARISFIGVFTLIIPLFPFYKRAGNLT